MSAQIISFISLAIARVSYMLGDWQIDCRGPRSARRYYFTSEGEAAEFALVLRDSCGWKLRFSAGTDEVRALVDELTEGDTP